jgi:putative sterol carrier protein
MNEEEWFAYLRKMTDKLNSYEECKDLIKSVGQATFQYKITDHESYSFAQEYDGTRVTLHRGFVSDPTVTHTTTFEVMRGVFAGTTNPITATMQGKYKVAGNMAKLIKSQGILAYVRKAHSEII